MRGRNLYLKLESGGRFWEKAPKLLHTYVDMIMKKSEWEELGFKVKIDPQNRFRYKEYKKGKYWYSFRPYFDDDIKNDPLLQEAVNYKKKYLKYAKNIYFNRMIGISFKQIVTLPEHVKSYAESHLEYDNENLMHALVLINKALALKPNDPNYNWLYFEIKFALKDLSTIDEILKYFENDIDCFLHPGNMYQWIKLLVKEKQFAKANNAIKTVNILLDELINGNCQNRIYTPQDNKFYQYKKEEFNKKIAYLKKRITKHLLRNDTNSTKSW